MSYPIAYCGCDNLCESCEKYRANCNTSLCKNCERKIQEEKDNCDHKMERYYDGFLEIEFQRCKKHCGYSIEVYQNE